MHLVEVPRFPRSILVLPSVSSLRHLGFNIEQFLLFVEPLTDGSLIDLFVFAGLLGGGGGGAWSGLRLLFGDESSLCNRPSLDVLYRR